MSYQLYVMNRPRQGAGGDQVKTMGAHDGPAGGVLRQHEGRHQPVQRDLRSRIADGPRAGAAGYLLCFASQSFICAISFSCALTMSVANRRISGSVPYCNSTFAMSVAP